MSEKESYQKKLDAKLKEWNAEIDKLKAKAEAAEADAEIEYQKSIDAIQEKKAEAEQKASELRNAGDSAWEDLKTGIESASKELSDALTEAKSRFK